MPDRLTTHNGVPCLFVGFGWNGVCCWAFAVWSKWFFVAVAVAVQVGFVDDGGERQLRFGLHAEGYTVETQQG